MNKYGFLLSFLSLPEAARGIALRTLEVPLYTETPFDAYGFVPALVPLWATDSPDYTGYWKHWFTPQRQPTFVEVSVEGDDRATEVARSFAQLVRRMTLNALTAEGSFTPEIETFALQVGIIEAELKQLVFLAQTRGDNDAGLLVFPVFAQDPPLTCCRDRRLAYTGDFPFDDMVLTEQALRGLCTFETSEVLQKRIAASPLAPPWFTADDQPALFTTLLQEQDLSGAWMTLNSTGWRFSEARDAIQRLGSLASPPGFDLLIQAWAAEPHENRGMTAEQAGY